jgi:hypothetical protein
MNHFFEIFKKYFFLHCDELFSDIEKLFAGSLRRRLATGNVEVFCRV